MDRKLGGKLAGKSGEKLKIGALISGGGTNLQAIIDACHLGRIDAEIVFTGSDVAEVKGLGRAKKAGINTFVVDYSKIIADCRKSLDIDSLLPKDCDLENILDKQRLVDVEDNYEKARFFIKSRVIAERELLDHIESYDMDLLVLAGFMRMFTPYFIDRINNGALGYRIMNIHPALLPAFPGVDGYGDTFRYGCKIGGCTVHYIDYGEDTGPIIGQKAFEIADGDTLEDVKGKGLKKEWELYPACIQKFAESR